MHGIQLAQDRRALVAITLPKEADRVTRFAAAELRRYLGLISGAAFVVQDAVEASAGGHPEIALSSSGTRANATEMADGFSLRSQGSGVTIRGTNPRGTLYGVYAFLEDLGCQFVEPEIEDIPRVHRLAWGGRNREERAAFPLRNVFRNILHVSKTDPFTALDPSLTLAEIDWLAKQRLNHYEFYVDYNRYDLWEKHKEPILSALLDRGFMLEVTHHSIHYFCPPTAYFDFGGFGPSTYTSVHPDWHEGVYWHTHVEKPAIQKVLIERLLAYVQRNPEIDIVGLWPDDGPMAVPYRGLSATDGHVKFWNIVGRELANAFPQKRLGIIAYLELKTPPQRQKPGRNLHCWFCPIERNYMYPLTDARNRAFVGWLKGWIRQMPPRAVATFDYYGWQSEPTPFRHLMQQDFALYQDLGLGGVYTWAGFTTNILGNDYCRALDMVSAARLLWNPTCDLTPIAESWARNVFAEAAEPVLELRRLLERVFAVEAKRGLAPRADWLRREPLHHAQRLLLEARRRTRLPRARQRVDKMEKSMCRAYTDAPANRGGARMP